MKISKLILTVSLILVAGTALATIKVPANPYKQPKAAFNYVYSMSVTQHTSDPWAEYLLGSYYEKGYGTKKDTDKAYVWYRMSTDHDYKPAVAALANLKKTMSASQIQENEKAFIVTRKASVKRELNALKNIVGR